MRVQFVLIDEGTSDDGLIPHLEALCMEVGADEVIGTAPDLGRLPESVGHALEDKIPVILTLEPQANLIFLHRDADSPRGHHRHSEIVAAVEKCQVTTEYVAVVPVQEIEAWLLLDEKAIRTIAGRPNGASHLNLPDPAHVERVANPKEHLRAALIGAAELTGRRHKRFVAQFSSHRRHLLHRLPVGGPLVQVPAWLKMKDATANAVARLRAAGT